MSALAAEPPHASPPDPGPGPDLGTVGDVTVVGHRLHVCHRPGAPGRRPLVLINGIGASLEFLDPLVAALDPERPVVRFDVPGIGGSPAPCVPLPMAGLAFLLAGLLDELGYARADVLGLSWGGGIAQQFALQHPDRTGKLALVSTGMGAMMVPARLSVLAKMLTPRRYNDRNYRHDAGAEIYVGESQ
ncbi:MAG TPA: alpha/beta hydrolase, partial [Actinomycetospora sp.]|nr:alpha/beta hydrolase [Actinomycetospora sp.]